MRASRILVLTVANSATDMLSMPARQVFIGEVDACPAPTAAEGGPVTLAKAGATAVWHRHKAFMASTPTIRGPSRIERGFEVSDQRRCRVPRPYCGAMQWLQFDRLRRAKGQPETATCH